MEDQAEQPGVARKLTQVVPGALEGFVNDRCPQHAAGIAYRALFSLAPLAIVLVSIFGFVLKNDELRADVVDAVVDVLPVSAEGRADVERAITSIAPKAGPAGLVGLLVFGWAASGMMGSVRIGLEAAMGARRGRPFARAKLVDALLVVGAGLLVLLLVFGNALAQITNDDVNVFASWIGLDGGLIESGVRYALQYLVSVVVVLLLYRFVPARQLSARAALVGALFTALLMLGLSLASGFIYAKTEQLSAVYGSLTVIFVFLYSVYLYACALLLGAEVAAGWARPPVAAGPSAREQVRGFVVGLFTHRDPPAR